MIKPECFTKEWITGFRQQKELTRIDPSLLEKMIFALSLVQHLQTAGLDFVFRGGTSLILMLEDANRFSIDVDIIVNKPYLEKTTRHQIGKVLREDHSLVETFQGRHISALSLDNQERSFLNKLNSLPDQSAYFY